MEFDYSDNDPSRMFKIKNTLEVRKSDYQTIGVYETEYFGKMLVSNGYVMFTKYDNFAYREMIT